MALADYFSQLIQEVVSLFGGKTSYNRPPVASPTQPTTNFIGSPGGYTPPIHGTWYNLGGFTTVSPNPRHPRGHMGLDMSCSAGTPVYAFAPGVVSAVGTDPDGGNIVGVTHAGGLWSYYAHMSTVKVQKGDKVDPGTVLGTVGNTGNAAGGFPHLHFGVKENGAWVDPARFFSVPKYNPNYASNPTKYMPKWTSEQAQQEAESFSMRDHLAERRVAFSQDVEKLFKLSAHYYRLSKS